MDGSYGNVFPAGRAMPPGPTASSNTNQYKINVNRQKTKKWANFKPQNYDGDDWGADDDDDVGYEPEPAPPPKPFVCNSQRRGNLRLLLLNQPHLLLEMVFSANQPFCPQARLWLRAQHLEQTHVLQRQKRHKASLALAWTLMRRGICRANPSRICHALGYRRTRTAQAQGSQCLASLSSRHPPKAHHGSRH
ncbi:cce049b2-af66-46df-b265-8d38ae00e0d2 [Thermothielavioides terrestris]|uniref:Cce049b2-af66-46df-b265-8d38ae00e0d2 n=1 Tax=Thermothielavioides terrestris TaxID=2587410 RepID=A0A3S4EYX7_9PEZI|nr:cce049b2-af66-46df-b265-8d38ae00e0d2 [Thermothielavioides terrestris]